MRNSLCEKIIWRVLSPTIFKFIEQHWKEIDMKRIKKLSKDNYNDMIKRTPDIGGFIKNLLRVHFAGGILWLSVYNAMEGEMNQKEFEEMVGATIEAPMIKKNFQKQNPFDIKV